MVRTDQRCDYIDDDLAHSNRYDTAVVDEIEVGVADAGKDGRSSPENSLGHRMTVLIPVSVQEHALEIFGQLQANQDKTIKSREGPRTPRHSASSVALAVTIRQIRHELSQIADIYRFGAMRADRM